MVSDLEEAAKCLEVVPKTIPGLDRHSNEWNNHEYLRSASGIRALKKWVLLPKAETRVYLEREIRRVLELVAAGDWDRLPQADLPQDEPIPWWRRALRLVRSIIVAAIPPVAVTVFGAQLSQSELGKYVIPGAWIWALVSLLAVLDPRFGDKLSALKDLPNFLPFGGKKER